MPTRRRSYRAMAAAGRRDRKSTRLNSSHTVIYTLSLHDALPISSGGRTPFVTSHSHSPSRRDANSSTLLPGHGGSGASRSEEHTSELQSHSDLHSFPTRRSSDLVRRKDAVRDKPLAFAVEARCQLVDALTGPWRQRGV